MKWTCKGKELEYFKQLLARKDICIYGVGHVGKAGIEKIGGGLTLSLIDNLRNSKTIEE